MRARPNGVAVSVVLLVLAALVASWFYFGSAVVASADRDRSAGSLLSAAAAPEVLAPAVPTPVQPSDIPTTGPESRSLALQLVDSAWASQIASRTGVPERAIVAYAAAELTVAAEQPECKLGWNTLAGIGSIETQHGSHGGAVLQRNGDTVPAILGPALDGNGFAAIPDTDGGVWDGDTQWDRAVGPMQFIPSTWALWGADGNGDGVNDPNNIDDASLAAARYLCASGSMQDAASWRAAVFSYNHLDSYVDAVAQEANTYASRALR